MIKPISIVIPYKLNEGDLELWVQVRESGDELAGMLEFPGGKIESGESPKIAGIREVKEECQVDLELYKNKLHFFKSISFSNDLIIFVHLFDDLRCLFPSESYKSSKLLLDSENSILPNNHEIIQEIELYFQGLTK